MCVGRDAVVKGAGYGCGHEPATPRAPRSCAGYMCCAFAFGTVLGGGYGIWKSGLTNDSLQPFVIGAGLAFYLPEITLTIMRRSRMQKIVLQLPDGLDLLVVCVEAGLGLDAAMRKVTEEMNGITMIQSTAFA